jgi:hypothetical protein
MTNSFALRERTTNEIHRKSEVGCRRAPTDCPMLLSALVFEFQISFGFRHLGFRISVQPNVFKDLQPSIVRIRDIDLAVVSDRDTVREPELAWLGAGFADGEQEASLLIENLKIVEHGVERVETPGAIKCDPLGTAKVTRGIAQSADFPFVFAIGGEFLDAAVHGIGDVQKAQVIAGEVGGKIELPIAAATGSKFLQKVSREIKLNDGVPLRIGDKQLVIQDGYGAGPLETVGDL